MFDDVFTTLESAISQDHVQSGAPTADLGGYAAIIDGELDDRGSLYDIAAAQPSGTPAEIAPVDPQLPAPIPPSESPTPGGAPLVDAAHWHRQQGENSCAVVAQASVLEEIRGVPFDERAASAEAEARGLFDPETGTPPWAMGGLLEAHGVACARTYGAGLGDLADALERGDKVIVALNANEIWTPVHDPATGLPVPQDVGGHAAWVTGLQQRPDGSVQVLLNDSGTDSGRIESVHAADFLNAWADYGGLMVVAHA